MLDVENTFCGDNVKVTSSSAHRGGFESHAKVANLTFDQPYEVERVDKFYSNTLDKNGEQVLTRCNVYLKMFPGRRFDYLSFENCN